MRFDNFSQCSRLHHFSFLPFFIAVTVEFHFISVSRERKYFRNLFDSNVDKFFAWLSFAVSFSLFCSFYFSFCFSDVFILTYAYNMQRNFFYTWKIYLFIFYSDTFFHRGRPEHLRDDKLSESSDEESEEASVIVQLSNRVQDGTRCRPGSLDMCIQGKCQVRDICG